MTALVDHAAAHRERLTALSPTIERERRVPADVARELAAEGHYRMLVPATMGGGEVHPQVFVDVLETLATGDAATAWTVMTGSTTGLLAAYLDRPTAEGIFGDPAVVPAGVFAPLGQAEPVTGGYRLRGRWSFASGIDNATVCLLGALVMEGGKPRMLPSGAPELRSLLVDRDALEVHDTWDTSGLRGTGSHDVTVTDVFVPTERTACLFLDGPAERGPLYRFSLFGLLALGVSAVGLGIARAALDEVRALAAKKKRGRRSLAETELAQVRLAEAEGTLGAARAFVRQTIAEAWAQPELTDDARARLRLAATHAARASATVVDAAYHLGGGAAIYARNPLQRAFRDMHTVTQHVMVAEPTLKPVGKVLFGLPTDVSQL